MTPSASSAVWSRRGNKTEQETLGISQLLIISWLIFDYFQLWHDLVTVALKE